MATIKSYTNLEQSRKLAEILPLESADMYYPWYIEDDGDTIKSGHRITTPNIGNFTTHKINRMVLPCWSLVSLLSVLPMIRKGKDIANPFIAKTPDNEYYVVYATLTEEVYNSAIYNSPINACYELILKLHELNLL